MSRRISFKIPPDNLKKFLGMNFSISLSQYFSLANWQNEGLNDCNLKFLIHIPTLTFPHINIYSNPHIKVYLIRKMIDRKMSFPSRILQNSFRDIPSTIARQRKDYKICLKLLTDEIPKILRFIIIKAFYVRSFTKTLSCVKGKEFDFPSLCTTHFKHLRKLWQYIVML